MIPIVYGRSNELQTRAAIILRTRIPSLSYRTAAILDGCLQHDRLGTVLHECINDLQSLKFRIDYFKKKCENLSLDPPNHEILPVMIFVTAALLIVVAAQRILNPLSLQEYDSLEQCPDYQRMMELARIPFVLTIGLWFTQIRAQMHYRNLDRLEEVLDQFCFNRGRLVHFFSDCGDDVLAAMAEKQPDQERVPFLEAQNELQTVRFFFT